MDVYFTINFCDHLVGFFLAGTSVFSSKLQFDIGFFQTGNDQWYNIYSHIKNKGNRTKKKLGNPKIF